MRAEVAEASYPGLDVSCSPALKGNAVKHFRQRIRARLNYRYFMVASGRCDPPQVTPLLSWGVLVESQWN